MTARPSHEQVADAVGRLDDAELAAWVDDPGGYVLRRREAPLREHTLWLLGPVDASHPVSVHLVSGPAGVHVTTERPDAVARVLGEEGTVDPLVVFELLRPHGERLELLDGEVSRLDERAEVVSLEVVGEAGPETWTVELRGDIGSLTRDRARRG